MDEDAGDGREGLRNVGAGLRLVLFGLVATVAAEVGFGAATASLSLATQAKAPAAEPAAKAADGDKAEGEAKKDLQAEMGRMYRASRKSIVLRTLDARNPGAAMALNAMVVLACVLGVTGKVFCARAPEAAGVAPFAIASIVFEVMGLALYASGQVGPLGEDSADLVDLAPLPWLIAYFLFLRYLARISAHLGSARLVGRVRLQQVGSFGILLATLLAAGLAAAAGLLGLLLALVIVNVGTLAMVVLYVRLLLESRRAAERAAEVA